MFRRTRPLALAGVAAAVLAVPPTHAIDTWGGLICGMTTSNVFSPKPNRQFGEIDGGPWTVINLSGGTVFDVTITCTVQLNDGTHGAGGTARGATTDGNVGLLLDTITYQAEPDDTVYLCTQISWNSSKGHVVMDIDGDGDSSNGIGCAEAFPVIVSTTGR